MNENKDKLKIEEEQERLKEFLDILLEADLRTIKRLNEERQQKSRDNRNLLTGKG